MDFFAEDALPVSTVAGFEVPVFQKRGQCRTKLSVVTGQDSSRWPVRSSSPLSNNLFSCSFEIAFFADNSSYFLFPVFFRSFTKASKTLFASVKAGSEIMENGLLCGGERRKRSVAALMDFVDELL